MTSHALHGSYGLLDRLGTGGVGEVWRARDRWLKRPVAIELLSRELADDAESTARLRTEGISGARLNRLRAVTRHGVGYDGPNHLVIERGDHGPLRGLLTGETLTPHTVVLVVSPAAHALAAAHHRGLVHGDITPGKGLLKGEGMAKVGGLRIARSVQAMAARLAAPKQVVRTALHLAPERCARRFVQLLEGVLAGGSRWPSQPARAEGTRREAAASG